jgi:hypothetical protein
MWPVDDEVNVNPSYGSVALSGLSWFETALACLLHGLVAHFSEDCLKLFHVRIGKFVVLKKEEVSEFAPGLIIA